MAAKKSPYVNMHIVFLLIVAQDNRAFKGSYIVLIFILIHTLLPVISPTKIGTIIPGIVPKVLEIPSNVPETVSKCKLIF